MRPISKSTSASFFHPRLQAAAVVPLFSALSRNVVIVVFVDRILFCAPTRSFLKEQDFVFAFLTFPLHTLTFLL